MTKLDALVDCRGIMDEMCVKRATAEAIMRAIPKVKIGRRVFVKRDDVRAEMARREAA